MIENLAGQAGEWGAFHVIAEVDETSDAFVPLRRSGFAVSAWQRIWDVCQIADTESRVEWTKVKSVHVQSMQNLYHQIVPPLLHPVEPMPKRAIGLICSEGARCYVQLTYGLVGIVLTLLIHPEATDVAEKLAALLNHLPERRGRPVYLNVRSYQAWLEPGQSTSTILLGFRGIHPGQYRQYHTELVSPR